MHVLLVGLSLALPAIVVLRGLQARRTPLRLAGDVLRVAYLPVLSVAIVLRPSAVRSGASILGSVLAVWGIWHDLREWRRAKATAESTVAADSASRHR